MVFDFLIVGAGFSGSVLAERLASQLNKKILIIDRRDHVGGNCFDYYNDFGVLVHKYGPHYFRTNSEEVFQYLSKFTEWRKYEYRIKSYIDGELYPFPVNRDTLNKFFKVNLKTEEEARAFLDGKRVKIENPRNSEDQIVSQAGWEIYNAFFKNYTKKQWDLFPHELDASVTGRISIRTNTDDRYFNEKYQIIPLNGYYKLFERSLNHSNITMKLNVEFRSIQNKIKYKNLIYTGCIDEFFNYKFGKLPYRSLEFKHENYNKEFYQKWVQINYPNEFEYTRIVEIKHATGQKTPKTTIIKEYPRGEGDPFYPIPREENQNLYEKYKKEANKLKNVIFIGRLAQYKYLNMDQVVKNALNTFKWLKNKIL
ncbi:MAG: UDP-galactopyranose mutase [Promethearchaeota archaeon]